MKGLSDLLKEWMPELLDRIEEERRRVLEDPLVRRFADEHPELTELALRAHVHLLRQFSEEMQNCGKCPGLESCPNALPGHFTKLVVEMRDDGPVLYDIRSPCAKQIAWENQENIRRKIRTFHVDERALHHGYTTTEILDKDPERVAAVARILDYISATEENGLQTKGLYLVGGFGTGKTFLACYLLRELAKSGYSGAIVYMPEFVEDLKNMIGEPHRLQETVEALKTVDLLVLDDIGAENLSPWVRDHVLGSILNYRMGRKPTFFTSNHTLDELEKHFSFTARDGEEEYKGRRIMDRIRPYVDVVLVRGRNHRHG